MIIGGDPEELHLLGVQGPGQAFHLDHAARVLTRVGALHRARNRSSTVDTTGAVERLRWLSRRIIRLDDWVLRVAAALHTADAESVRSRLLALGPEHPAAPAATDGVARAAALPVARLSSAELDQLAAWPRLPGTWRDRLHRERMRRWIAQVDDRVAAVPGAADGGLLDRLATWVDRSWIEVTSPVVDLHHSRDERVAQLRAEAAGVRQLLADGSVTIWSFTPEAAYGRPTVRIALGDVDTATQLAVLLPGTGSGLHAPSAALADARALHTAATGRGPSAVATVLDLYAAPTDLGRAGDPAPGRVAGRSTAAFLSDLPEQPIDPTQPTSARRITVVGHSYGAYTAAQAARASDAVDALVLLGAPGTGVHTRAELPAKEVWAALAPEDPIVAVADLDEHIAALPDRLRPNTGPLADPLVALGPDPTDPEFGAQRLPTDSSPDGGTPATGHVAYLALGTASLANVARVVRGLPVRSRRSTAVRRGMPPTRVPRGSAAAG